MLDLRHKYLRVSLQRHGDNPKDDPAWQIYPPPPPPVWVEGATEKEAATSAEKAFWSGTSNPELANFRKPGENIGEDFKYDDIEFPDEHDIVYKLDDNGVYQVYESQAGAFGP